MGRLLLRLTALNILFLWVVASVAFAAPPTLSAQGAILMDSKNRPSTL